MTLSDQGRTPSDQRRTPVETDPDGSDSGRDHPSDGGAVGGLAGALAEATDKLSFCVHCGFCLSACPTYLRLGDEADSPRGRLHLMRAVVEGRLDPGSSAFQTHIDRCLGCRACEPVCPSGVEYGHLLERARQTAAASRPPAAGARALLSVMGSRALQPVFMLVSRIFRATGVPALGARILPQRGLAGRGRLALAMLAASAPSRRVRGARGERPRGPDAKEGADPAADSALPTPSAGEAATADLPPGSEIAAATPEPRPRVAVLTGCVQEGLFSRVNRATVRVLRANGFPVVRLEDQGCCGALHAHGGALERARELARSNVEAFERSDAELLIVNAAGCGSTVKDYGDLFEEETWKERGRELARRTRDVTEILAEAGPRRGAALELRVAYDPPCHLLHAQRVADPPLTVLSAVPGLERVPLENADECCGGAGIYGITHPELGGRIGSDKVEAIARSGAEVVATGNPGCIMQIGAGLRMAGVEAEAVHPVELLDESYRRAGYYEDAGRAGGARASVPGSREGPMIESEAN